MIKPRTIDRATALISLAPETEWVVRDNEIEWINPTGSEPSIEEIDTEVERLTDAEPMRMLRLERDKKLAETDWVTVRATDTGIPVSDEWNAYRQALRDITNTYTSLDNVVWPVPPTVNFSDKT